MAREPSASRASKVGALLRQPATYAAAAALTLAAAEGYWALPASAQIAVKNQGYVPYSDAPINYRSRPLTDPVAALQKQLDAGEAKLVYEPDHGYLKSVLKLLNVPADSQTLVFSKTSFQFTKISPDHPRALYYNDDVYVGSVHDGKTIEIVSFDPSQGAVFYLLDEEKAEKPAFQRAELDCTQCHIAAATRGIPGVFLRSVYPTDRGTVAGRAPSFVTDQKSPLKERWGGWYVGGGLAKGSLGNAILTNASAPNDAQGKAAPLELGAIANPYDKKSYITPESDPVALLVLGHQTQMHNLITLTNYQTRLALYGLTKDADPAGAQRVADGLSPAPTLEALPESARQQIEKPAEQLLRYLLFVDEAPLGGQGARKVIAASPFAREFARRGERDSKGRSLRDFDLRTRIFAYPCSYLIYSSAFDAIPDPARGYIYHRLLQVLSGQDQSPDFAGLSAGDRQAILTILLQTKAGLPDEWRDYARAHRLRVAAASTVPRHDG